MLIFLQDKLPRSLTHLTLSTKFNQSIDSLPPSVTHLKMNGNFDLPIHRLPRALTHLTIRSRYNSPLPLPPSLVSLTLGNGFNCSLEVFFIFYIFIFLIYLSPSPPSNSPMLQYLFKKFLKLTLNSIFKKNINAQLYQNCASHYLSFFVCKN